MKKITLILSVFIFSMFIFTSCNLKEKAENAANNMAEDIANDIQDEINEVTNNDAFSSEKHAFSINFPAAPVESVKDVPTDVGNIAMTTYTYEESLEVAYMVAVADYPGALIESSDPQDLLAESKGGYIGDLGLTVTKESQKDVGGTPGLYFEAEGSDGETNYFTAVHDVLQENRLFQVAILRTDRMPTQAEIDNFIGTFTLK